MEADDARREVADRRGRSLPSLEGLDVVGQQKQLAGCAYLLGLGVARSRPEHLPPDRHLRGTMRAHPLPSIDAAQEFQKRKLPAGCLGQTREVRGFLLEQRRKRPVSDASLAMTGAAIVEIESLRGARPILRPRPAHRSESHHKQEARKYPNPKHEKILLRSRRTPRPDPGIFSQMACRTRSAAHRSFQSAPSPWYAPCVRRGCSAGSTFPRIPSEGGREMYPEECDPKQADPTVEALRAFFVDHPDWRAAAGRLDRAACSRVSFTHLPGRDWRLLRRGGRTVLEPGRVTDPDFALTFSPIAIERIVAARGGMAAFAIALFEAVLDPDSLLGVRIEILASFARLVRRGYLGLLLACGPRLLAFGARHGVRSVGDLRAMVRDRTDPPST